MKEDKQPDRNIVFILLPVLDNLQQYLKLSDSPFSEKPPRAVVSNILIKKLLLYMICLSHL